MKKRHIQTNFIKFIIEKYSNEQEPHTDFEDDEEIQIQEEEPEKPTTPQLKKIDKDLEGTNDDDIVDELVQEYQKLKKAYENRRLCNRRKL
jgi:hypothetical protein